MSTKLSAEQVVNMVKRHDRMLDIMLFALADHAVALVASLPQCDSCSNTATVEHQHDQVQACDRCCAESIISRRENPIVWLDLPHATEIRHVFAHFDEITELDGQVH